MFRLAVRLVVLLSLVVGSVAVLLAAPEETAAPSVNAGWEEMGVGSASGGGISNNSTYSASGSVAIGSSGLPIVAWYDNNGDSEVYARRWNGSAWVELAGSASGGGISDNSRASVAPSVVVGPDGAPVVAWWESGNVSFSEIYVRRWNGVAWAEMGSGSASGGGISNNEQVSDYPSMAIGPDGMPVVAWEDDSNGFAEIYIRRWNGSAWVELAGSASGGGVSNSSGRAERPSLAVGPDGAPVVAWHDNSDGDEEIYVRRWNGSSWVELAGSASGGGVSNSVGRSHSPSIAIAPDSAPVVAWVESMMVSEVQSREIYVRRWNGSGWVEIGSGSASGGGISNDDHESIEPSVAVGLDGVPVIAWYDNGDDDQAIYVRRWNGAAWAEIDDGSASEGGISGDRGIVGSPSLVIGPDGTAVVAWYDGRGGSDPEVYVRRYQPCTPSWLHRSSQPSSAGIVSLTALHTLFLPSIHLKSYSTLTETEPNDRQSQATGPICSGRDVMGLPNDRYDVFSLDADAGLITVDLTNHVSQNVQLQLHHQVITPNPIGHDFDGADGYHIELANAPAGRYYVVISTLAPNPGTTTGYVLSTAFNMSR